MEHEDDFLDISLLGQSVLAFPFNTACCERDFSVMKHIKTDWRANLDPDTLTMLMKVEIEGKATTEFEPERAVVHWWNKGQRARRPNFMDK